MLDQQDERKIQDLATHVVKVVLSVKSEQELMEYNSLHDQMNSLNLRMLALEGVEVQDMELKCKVLAARSAWKLARGQEVRVRLTSTNKEDWSKAEATTKARDEERLELEDQLANTAENLAKRARKEEEQRAANEAEQASTAPRQSKGATFTQINWKSYQK